MASIETSDDDKGSFLTLVLFVGWLGGCIAAMYFAYYMSKFGREPWTDYAVPAAFAVSILCGQLQKSPGRRFRALVLAALAAGVVWIYATRIWPAS
ncbi:MAG: hypothetical protein R3286_04565 [Gammaproteobacteria bacterium]|nr:hypothetical protein [Gammaproteobacteria bacterium]